MLIVSIESPFELSDSEIKKYEGRYSRADLLRQNLIYARMAYESAILRGEAPFSAVLHRAHVAPASKEIAEGMKRAGVELHYRCDLVAQYVDLGTTGEMRLSSDNAQLIGVALERRAILQSGTRDPREMLAALDLPAFPLLEELQAEEYRATRSAARTTRA